MPIFRKTFAAFAVLGLLAAMSQHAVAKDPPAPSAHLGSLTACRNIPDNVQRLACYDKAAGDLIAATEKGDVSVVDRAQVRQARRSLFGFNMPSLPFFSGDKSAEDVQDEIESTITATREMNNGRFQIRISDGNALWETLETYRALRSPENGQKITIRRGPLGSYILRINGQRGVKGRRIG